MQPDPPMSRPIHQVIPQNAPDIPEHLRITGGMKTVAAIIDTHAREFEAARVSADSMLLLQHRDPDVASPAQLKGRSQTRRPCAQYGHPWLRHIRLLDQIPHGLNHAHNPYGM